MTLQTSPDDLSSGGTGREEGRDILTLSSSSDRCGFSDLVLW